MTYIFRACWYHDPHYGPRPCCFFEANAWRLMKSPRRYRKLRSHVLSLLKKGRLHRYELVRCRRKRSGRSKPRGWDNHVRRRICREFNWN